ncbi:NAD(P)-dependent dehydrogenase (short-subunit alcohol dehydrogenase family) [Flavobacterium sp. 7E]|uniref:SDR family oxidoreductase n=1 Tax=Flavobacterium sp. 7E TaxID=2735898 RepID=UPI00156FDBA1|nr:SDR family oxidoreductase [Flavobacterium sp. 7E]NRS90170.1 NAD(P)-dependent dehydrogenase (short-subunit alcohol dehydrogenase family) [Flavobacterium sp. 7E]
MNSILKNKVIIVTGGSGLLGKEIIKDLCAKGSIAINADINVSTDFEKQTLKVDITSEESVEKAIMSVIDFYGKIDGLVNNAYPRTKDWGTKFEDITYESWQRNIDMQMNTTFLFIQKVMPELLKTKGSIVNMTSIYGVVGNDLTIYENTSITTAAPYSAIKGGVINFTRYLASYYGRQGVRVNCVSPGGIFDNQHETFVSNYEKKVPMGRMGNPDDIAPSVSFLLSEEAKYITGQNLIVDGGWTSI